MDKTERIQLLAVFVAKSLDAAPGSWTHGDSWPCWKEVAGMGLHPEGFRGKSPPRTPRAPSAKAAQHLTGVAPSGKRLLFSLDFDQEAPKHGRDLGA